MPEKTSEHRQHVTDHDLLIEIHTLLKTHLRDGQHHATPCDASKVIEKRIWGLMVTALILGVTIGMGVIGLMAKGPIQ